jgi:hypothetical protein
LQFFLVAQFIIDVFKLTVDLRQQKKYGERKLDKVIEKEIDLDEIDSNNAYNLEKARFSNLHSIKDTLVTIAMFYFCMPAQLWNYLD